jgi:hypothetical protein
MTNSSGARLRSIYGAAVNNAMLDPIQGFDVDVWAADQATGEYRLAGRFTSLQVTVRNATEPYLEFNQRSPRYLDGEFQIGWVLERGMLDSRVLEQTFGFSSITRELRLSRSPRMQIMFEFNAPELDQVSRGGATDNQETRNDTAGTFGNGELNASSLANNQNLSTDDFRRLASGKYMLSFCKVDSFTFGATAGRSVVANRWEGLAENIEMVQTTNIWAGTTLNLDASRSADRALNNLSALQSSARNIGLPSNLNSETARSA